jgi:hypothetical protein
METSNKTTNCGNSIALVTPVHVETAVLVKDVIVAAPAASNLT